MSRNGGDGCSDRLQRMLDAYPDLKEEWERARKALRQIAGMTIRDIGYPMMDNARLAAHEDDSMNKEVRDALAEEFSWELNINFY